MPPPAPNSRRASPGRRSGDTHRSPPVHAAKGNAAAGARFFCPVCKCPRRYEIRQVRSRFPYALWSERHAQSRVVCRMCSREFPLSALEFDPASVRQERLRRDRTFVTAIQRAMAIVAISDGRLTDHEIETMRAVCERVTGHAWDDEGLDDVLLGVRGRYDDVLDDLRRDRERLSVQQRQKVMRATVLVAATTQATDSCVKVLLARIGEALAVSPRTVRRLIDEAAANAPENA